MDENLAEEGSMHHNGSLVVFNTDDNVVVLLHGNETRFLAHDHSKDEFCENRDGHL